MQRCLGAALTYFTNRHCQNIQPKYNRKFLSHCVVRTIGKGRVRETGGGMNVRRKYYILQSGGMAIRERQNRFRKL